MRAKFVFEKFTEDSDPIKDLGIGDDPKRNWFNLAEGDMFEIKENTYIKLKKGERILILSVDSDTAIDNFKKIYFKIITNKKGDIVIDTWFIDFSIFKKYFQKIYTNY